MFDFLLIKIMKAAIHLFANFQTIEESVSVYIVVANSMEFRCWSCGSDARVTSVEVGINHQLFVKNQAGIIDG